MPIHRHPMIEDIGPSDFEIIDHAVMPHAYAVHNCFGPLFDEMIYENELAHRLRSDGFEVHTQVPVRVAHVDFGKTFRLDMIVNGMPYEIKAVSSLTSAHQAQALNYAMLQDVSRIKLLNFGGPKVRGWLLRNAVAGSGRHNPVVCRSRWRCLTKECGVLQSMVDDLVRDWGTHLSAQLYAEALVHQLGGEESCVRRVAIEARGQPLGTHSIRLHAPDHAFVLTTLTTDRESCRRHLLVLLEHTRLAAIQWINLNHSRIELTTLEKNGTGVIGKGIEEG